jgi:hypothetical protein
VQCVRLCRPFGHPTSSYVASVTGAPLGPVNGAENSSRR